jgi:hypothetical protein
MIKTVFRVTLPDELFQPFMQHIRDFDMQHDPNHEGRVHFESLSDSDWPVEKMAEVLSSVTPQTAYMYGKRYDKGENECLCVVGCATNGECPIHGDEAMGRR